MAELKDDAIHAPIEHKAVTTRGGQTTQGAAADTPAADTPAAKKDEGFAPITASDDEKNPVKVAVPKTAQEIATEGTALGEANADATGGDAPVLSSETPEATRIWSLDADHNVNLRNGGAGSHTSPDLVELGG